MLLYRTRRLRHAGALMLGLSCVGVAHAAPDDVFLQAEPATGEFTSFRVEASYDMVNKTVDVFNLRESQGAVADNAGDYRGGKLMLGYKFSPKWSGSATYWRRGIDYGQDNNQIDSWMLALHYDPLAEPGARDRIMLLPITQYEALFSLLGTNFGGDGRTTFALPNLASVTPNGLTYMICVMGIYPSRS